jgi:hypothetical protein
MPSKVLPRFHLRAASSKTRLSRNKTRLLLSLLFVAIIINNHAFFNPPPAAGGYRHQCGRGLLATAWTLNGQASTHLSINPACRPDDKNNNAMSMLELQHSMEAATAISTRASSRSSSNDRITIACKCYCLYCNIFPHQKKHIHLTIIVFISIV